MDAAFDRRPARAGHDHRRAIREVALAADGERQRRGVLVAVAVEDAVDLLRHDRRLADRGAQRRRAHHRVVQADLEEVQAAAPVAFVPARSPGDQRAGDGVPRRQVVDRLGLRVDEPERAGGLRIDAVDQPVDVALAAGHQPRAAAGAAQRALGHGRRRDRADRDAVLLPRPRSLAHAEVDLRSRPVAVALRVAAEQDRRALEDVAVEHRQRSGVAGPVDGVHEQRAGDAVERHAEVTERRGADREVAAVVVAAADAGQRLHGAHRVLGEGAAQLLDVGAADGDLAGDAGLPRRRRRRDLDVLGVGAGALREREGQLQGAARGDVDVAPDQGIADQRHLEDAAPGRQIGEHDAALRVRERAGLPVAVEADAGPFDRRAGGRVDDDRGDRSGGGLRRRGGRGSARPRRADRRTRRRTRAPGGGIPGAWWVC